MVVLLSCEESKLSFNILTAFNELHSLLAIACALLIHIMMTESMTGVF